jgi:transposase-like protein
LARVPKASAEMVAAAIRTVFAQPDPAHVRSQLDEVARMLDAKFTDVAAMRRDAAEDLLAYTAFPVAHWRKIWSTNPLERLNGEIKRRTNVVGICPNDTSIVRLVTAVLVETHDEWGRRRTPLPLRGIHGQDRRARHHRRRDTLSHHRLTH